MTIYLVICAIRYSIRYCLPLTMCEYEILGIHPSASLEEIKTAYRRLTLRYHPNKNQSLDAEEKFQKTKKFQKINKADSKLLTH